jgi:hypothetical protein
MKINPYLMSFFQTSPSNQHFENYIRTIESIRFTLFNILTSERKDAREYSLSFSHRSRFGFHFGFRNSGSPPGRHQTNRHQQRERKCNGKLS